MSSKDLSFISANSDSEKLRSMYLKSQEEKKKLEAEKHVLSNQIQDNYRLNTILKHSLDNLYAQSLKLADLSESYKLIPEFQDAIAFFIKSHDELKSTSLDTLLTKNSESPEDEGILEENENLKNENERKDSAIKFFIAKIKLLKSDIIQIKTDKAEQLDQKEVKIEELRKQLQEKETSLKEVQWYSYSVEEALESLNLSVTNLNVAANRPLPFHPDSVLGNNCS